MKKSATRRALLTSVLSLLLCVTTLLGSTFAWFTDEVESGVNQIAAGNLDVEVYHGDPEAGNSITDVNALFDEVDLWEPGAMAWEKLTVANVGSLALKYKMSVNFANATDNGEGKTLADVLQVAVMDAEPTRENIKNAELKLMKDFTLDMSDKPLKAGASESIYMAIYWAPSAIDNEFNLNNERKDKQPLKIDLGVVVEAAQWTSESDSFDNTYDADAKYPSEPVELVFDTWDGTADTAWYSEENTEFILTTAEQLAGLNELIKGGNPFADKTIKLGVNVDMAGTDWVVGNYDFSGTFDGQNYTIANLGRTVNAYESGRMGLFGHVEGGTIKNVTIDGAEFYGYGPYGGVIAGSAYGKCVFENITLKNCNNEMYNTGSAGIVGLAYSDSNYTFEGISIDSSNSIGSYWGSWDTASGALIGYFWKNGDALSPVFVKDCYIAPEMNVYNDVNSNYQWYAYRYAGMLIGYMNGSTVEVEGTTYPLADTVTCENVTVEYGDWANYYYCELVANSKASYTHEYQFSRLDEISSLDEIRSGDTWLTTGNFVLIDGEDATCYHIVKDKDTGELKQHLHSDAGTEEVNGETVDIENNICVKLVFDQLYGGGQGVYGAAAHNGVTVIYNNK